MTSIFGRMARPAAVATVAAVLAIITMTLAAQPAGAAVLHNESELRANTPMLAYLTGRDKSKLMFDAAVAMDKRLGIACASKYTIKLEHIIVERPIDLPDGAAEPRSGAWIYRYTATRCGSTKRFNILLAAQPGAKPKAGLLPPGGTLASPLLMHDALPSVENGYLVQTGQTCAGLQIFDIVVSAKPHTATVKGKSVAGVWDETWTMQGCGHKVDVPVQFVPDGHGGVYFTVRSAVPETPH